MKPNGMDKEIDKVILLVKTALDELQDDKLKTFKKTIKGQLLKRDINISERTQKVWNEIIENTLDFDRVNKLIHEIDNITKQDLVSFFQKTFIDSPNKLSIQIYAGKEIQTNATVSIQKYGLNDKINTTVTTDLNVLRQTPYISNFTDWE